MTVENREKGDLQRIKILLLSISGQMQCNSFVSFPNFFFSKFHIILLDFKREKDHLAIFF